MYSRYSNLRVTCHWWRVDVLATCPPWRVRNLKRMFCNFQKCCHLKKIISIFHQISLLKPKILEPEMNRSITIATELIDQSALSLYETIGVQSCLSAQVLKWILRTVSIVEAVFLRYLWLAALFCITYTLQTILHLFFGIIIIVVRNWMKIVVQMKCT